MLPGKLMYPKFLETVPCWIWAAGDETDEAGQAVESLLWNGRCIYRESAERRITADESVVNIVGTAIVSGGNALFLSGFSGGHLTVYPGSAREKTMVIHAVKKLRNPDGTVHHFSLELI
jgi:hypothetical protein